MEQEISSAKVKPDMPIQNFDKKMNFDDSDEIEYRLSLRNCPNILEYIWWVPNSGFNSQIPRRDLEVTYNNF